jgi:transposase-like protein
VRQAHIDRGDIGSPVHSQLTSQERAELDRLRKDNRELRREKDIFRLVAAHFAKEQLPPRGFA